MSREVWSAIRCLLPSEKVRQASAGMPAVMIRQLDALIEVLEQAPRPEQGRVLLEQGEMIRTLCLETVSEKTDREDVLRRYDALIRLAGAPPV